MDTISRSAGAARPMVATGSRWSTVSMGLDPLRLALFLLMVLTVSRIHQHYKFIAVLRPALLLAALTALYAFLNPKALSERGLFKTWPPRLVAALAIFACIAMPFGISLGRSGKFIIEEYSKTVILCFLLVVAIRHVRDLYTFVWAYVVASGILVWMSWFVFGIKKSTGSYAARLSNLYSFDANDIGCVLIIGLALALLMFQVRRGWTRWLTGAIIIGIGATMARSGSRGTFVGLVLFGLALLVMLKTVPVVKRLAFLVVTAVALAVAAPPGYWEQMGTLINPTADYNWNKKDGRKEVAKRGIDYMMSFPVFGLGIDNFQRAECTMSEKVRNHVVGTGLRCTPPHNSYIQAGAELGLPGLAMWSALVFGGIVSMWRWRRRVPAQWRTGDAEQRFLYLCPMYLCLAMFGFAVTSFFLSFAWLDMVYILAALMSGLMISVRRKMAEEKTTAAAMPATPPVRRVAGMRGGLAVARPAFRRG